MASPVKRLVRALFAAVAIVAVLVGVPTLLIAVASWPLPTSVPDWDNVYWSARQGDIPAEFVIKAFACVVWLAWAQIAWALLWELVVNVPRTLHGKAECPIPATAAPASRLARRLVTAAMLLTAITSTPATTAAAPSLSSLMSGGNGPDGLGRPATTLVVDQHDTDRAVTPTVSATWVSAGGDTLWDVAERCLGDGSRVDELLKCNPHLDPGRPLRNGQLVDLPEGTVVPTDRQSPGGTPGVDATPSERSGAHQVTAAAGDTVWAIAKAHYGWVDADLIRTIAQASGIADASLIHPGDVIVLPVVAEQPAPAPPIGSTDRRTVHRVVEGDTVWGITKASYGRADAETVWALAAVNHLENPSLIFPGQTLHLPPLGELLDGDAPATPPVETPTAGGPREPSSDPAVPNVEPSDVTAAPGTQPDDTTSPPVATGTPSTTQVEPEVPDPIVISTEAPQSDASTGPNLTAPPITSPSTSTSAAMPPTESTPRATPSTAAGHESTAAVSSQDMLSSRWLFGGGAATSLGLVGAWMTVKQLRRRRRRWLGLPEPELEGVEPSERERSARFDVSMLSEMVDPTLRDGADVRAVVLGERTEIRFRHTAPEPPAGWESNARAWVRSDDRTERWSPAPVLSPALVTIGRGVDDELSEVVLDLLAAGTVSVTGDRLAVERLVCSMLWELAADPLGAPVDLLVVGLACEAARHATNVGRLVTLDEAIAAANEPIAETPRVFLVDPFADDSANGSLGDLAAMCGPGSGRAVVVAGPCEHPSEQISVPSEQRALWDDLTLVPPQLPEHVDVSLGRMLDSIAVGRRDRSVSALAVTPDPEAEAVVLRSSILVDDRDGEESDHDAESEHCDNHDTPPPIAARVPDDSIEPPPAERISPDVVLTVCGREVGVRGAEVPHAPAVLFVLAAAGRRMHWSEIAEVTGYSEKSLRNRFPATNELVERADGYLQLADHVVTDHGWVRYCVTRLADAMKQDGSAADTSEWLLSAMEAIAGIEQAPFAVLPSARKRTDPSPWSWIDDFPADIPSRQAAETEVVEATLAFTELWLAAPSTHALMPAAQLVRELCRLAATLPYARVVRQLRDSRWVTGAECLLVAAARVAADDDTLLGRVRQAARELAAVEKLEASNELADELGL